MSLVWSSSRNQGSIGVAEHQRRRSHLFDYLVLFPCLVRLPSPQPIFAAACSGRSTIDRLPWYTLRWLERNHAGKRRTDIITP